MDKKEKEQLNPKTMPDKLYNILYEKSEVQGVRVLYEEDFPLDELVEFIQQEIDRAREEGYTKGVKDGMKGKVFEKIEIDTEVRFSDLKDVIDGKEDAGEFLSKLTK